VNRREVIAAIASAAVLPPLAAQAQQKAMPVVGFLGTSSTESASGRLTAVLQSLAQAGYVEGRDFVVERRSAEGHYDRCPALAADLVSRKVAVIAASGAPACALAAKAATSTILVAIQLGLASSKALIAQAVISPGSACSMSPLCQNSSNWRENWCPLPM
jgi:putative tryptophan/tyrosine transport system substrate-binding protein